MDADSDHRPDDQRRSAGHPRADGRHRRAASAVGGEAIYEPRGRAPISTGAFALRVARHFFFSLALLAASLAAGMAGYMGFERLPWRDAFLNSAMLLGGMGPVDAPISDGGKLFAGIYALYAGLLLIFVLALMLAPVLHRILHRFHWEQEGD